MYVSMLSVYGLREATPVTCDSAENRKTKLSAETADLYELWKAPVGHPNGLLVRLRLGAQLGQASRS